MCSSAGCGRGPPTIIVLASVSSEDASETRVVGVTAVGPDDVGVATSEERSRVADPIVLAFASDPLMRHVYPTPAAYRRHFPAFVDAYLGDAIDRGTAHYLGDFIAAAIWLPPGSRPDEAALVETLGETLSDEDLERAWTVLAELDECAPDEPHWYLPLIGVDPAHQRRGYGSTLLERALAACDEHGEYAYLESSNPENLALFARHGFEAVGTVRVDDVPPLFPMVRRPRE